jgi:hypothetical protein
VSYLTSIFLEALEGGKLHLMGHKNGVACVTVVGRGWGFTELPFASSAMWKCKETDPELSFARNAGSVSAATSAITMQRLGSSRSAGNTVSQLFPVQIYILQEHVC